MARLKEKYENEIRAALKEQLKVTNPHRIPKLEKIVINMGVGSAISDKKHIETAVSALTEISGQKPVVCKAKKSIANFKLREGQAIGCKTTLRGERMYEFLDRLISLVLPRVRDFRGLSRSAFDGHGNYSIGLSELLVFPELNPDKYMRVQGMNITLVSSSRDNTEGRALLDGFGVPFQRDED